MSNNKLLNRIINKLGQNIPENLPTEEVTATQTVSGNPPNFIPSNYYPELVAAFNSRNIPIINKLSNIINQALYYTSNGKIHLLWMYNKNFNFDSSISPSIELKNLMNFSKLMFQQLFSNLNKPLSSQEILVRINALSNSLPLNSLPQTSKSGQLTTKIGGDLKTIIKNYLLQIK
jgi:hypothetical protein